MDVTYLNFSKTFGPACSSILKTKLMCYGLGNWLSEKLAGLIQKS